MFIFGGFSNSLYNDLRRINLHTFDCELVKETLLTPIARCYHTMFAFNKKYLVLFGGASTSIKSINMRLCLNDVQLFDIEANTWERMPENAYTPIKRMNHVSCLFGSMMVCHGGYNTEIRRILGDINIFDFNRREWIKCVVCDEGDDHKAFEMI